MIFIIRLKNPAIVVASKLDPMSNMEDATAEAQETRRFANKPFSMSALAERPEIHQYRECLRKLGITDAVTLAEIKTSYRNSVKGAHPDLQQDHSDNDRFIELTKAYDNAVELHQLLGDDKDEI